MSRIDADSVRIDPLLYPTKDVIARCALEHDWGEDSEMLIKVTFAVSGALGAAAGFFMGTLYTIFPTMGALAGLKGWACAILGGIGSITGSLVGGLLIGIAENITSGLISTGYKDAISFAIMILVLLIRPTGLMGYKFEEKV